MNLQQVHQDARRLIMGLVSYRARMGSCERAVYVQLILDLQRLFIWEWPPPPTIVLKACNTRRVYFIR